MRKTTVLIMTLVLLAALAACEREKPAAVDGDGIISIAIVDTTGTMPGSVPGEPMVIPEAQVSLQARTHEQVETAESNDSGTADFAGLPAGEYSVFARREMPLGAQKQVFTGYADVGIAGTGLVEDTVYVSTVTVNALMINEIYYCGADYSTFYFYDQFVEIYNSSEDTLYLDGTILTRNYPTTTVVPGIEEIDFVRAIYAFQFPGTPVTGREYPIYPNQYVVVAADAVDHSVWADRAVDLSGADWEFFNPLGSDYDVPGIPNVVNIKPDSGIDFMINLSHNGVVFATGEEYGFEEYDEGKIRVTLPLYTVIDGVEYASSSDKTKEITVRVDAGFAGLGCTKYSGQSTERREIGIDSNNSTFDFTLIPKPTPGYSHVENR